VAVGEQEIMNLAENVVALNAAVLLGLHATGDVDAKKLAAFLRDVAEGSRETGYAPMLRRLTALLEANYSRASSSKPSFQIIEGGLADKPDD
jgi:hypothetical protein